MTSLLSSYVLQAISRHHSAARLVRALAEDMPAARGRPWQAIADALDSNDVDMAKRIDAPHAQYWLPLIASRRNDPQMLSRLVRAAGQRMQQASGGWAALAYPLVIVGFSIVVMIILSVLVMPVFSDMFTDFGLELPAATRAVIGFMGFLATGWGPLLVALGVIAVGRWILITRSPRGPGIAEGFTRNLAMLAEAGLPQQDAIALAATAVGLPPAAAASGNRHRPIEVVVDMALHHEAKASAILLSAIADCHADRARSSLWSTQWLIGPVAIGVVGLLVGLIMIALFMPLVRLVSELS